MASTPRILTVDPSWTISRIVRGAMDLIDRAIIQIDVSTGTEALEEIQRGGVNLLITDLELANDMRGFELAIRVSQASPETHVIILANVDDADQIDEETAETSPFVYMHRPVEIQQFSRVLLAALDGKNMKEALAEPVAAAGGAMSFGPVPALDLNIAQNIIDSLLSDLGAMAIVLSTRTGDVLMGRGAVGYVNNEKLSKALTPLVLTNIEFRELVGGQSTALQFYDGDTYDVFVLSVGMHHFLSVVFDGQIGSRQFGAVSRYGRRAAEDLIALLGTSAWNIQVAAPAVDENQRRKPKAKPIVVEEEEAEIIPLAKAEAFGLKEEESKPVEPERFVLEPIANLDLSIFDQLDNGSLNQSNADDLFDLDKLGEMAQQSSKGTALSYEQAQQLGLLPS